VREACAPVEIIHDSATRRIVDLTATDEERMAKAAWHLAQAEELMAPLNRECQWRLDARKAACTLEEVCGE
jgi:flavin reductase (DIM6/NTAB) family NADH-FMN oxidoreductase RutF